jgi:FKBP-type peptidyl-prolyl cis-trans isomerase (trigger factor)
VSSDDETAAPAAKTSIGKIIAFGIVVLVFLAAALFFLERNGTLSTGIFDAYFEQQAAAAVIATVNGEEIIGRDLTTSMDQFSEAAIAQGVDVSNPEFKEMVRERSLEVLINTELLKQEAAERGIVATEEEIVTRIESVEAQLGGAAVLDERIAELGIDRDRLREDISDEIVIQALLEEIFTEAEITITDEDVEALYEEAGGAEAGLPALEEVRPQVEAQIQAAREQEAIDTFLETLRSDADIQIQE